MSLIVLRKVIGQREQQRFYRRIVAPEVASGLSDYTTHADVFAFGFVSWHRRSSISL